MKKCRSCKVPLITNEKDFFEVLAFHQEAIDTGIKGAIVEMNLSSIDVYASPFALLERIEKKRRATIYMHVENCKNPCHLRYVITLK